ncbi:MAG: hypothetical protein ACRDUA_01785 [Micromonosporaceae bacterium]
MQQIDQNTGRVEFQITTGGYLRTNLMVFGGFALLYTLAMRATGWLTEWLVGYAQPVDTWDLALQPGLVLVLGVPAVLGVAALMARKRRLTVLTPYGVDYPPQGLGGRRGFVPWPAVVGVAVIRAGFVRLIGLRLADNRTVRVAPPFGYRRSDPRLAAALASFQGHAQRYGGRVDVPVRSATAVVGTVALVVFGLLATAGLVRLATSPVIPPWAPYASTLPDACDAAERAGLERHWPRSQRERLESEALSVTYLGDREECRGSAASEASTLSTMTVTIERLDDRFLRSGAAEAYDTVAAHSDYEDSVTPVEVGDIGYRWQPYDDGVTVAVCRGNVVVTVEFGGSDARAAGRAAERLAAGVLERIRFA